MLIPYLEPLPDYQVAIAPIQIAEIQIANAVTPLSPTPYPSSPTVTTSLSPLVSNVALTLPPQIAQSRPPLPGVLNPPRPDLRPLPETLPAPLPEVPLESTPAPTPETPTVPGVTVLVQQIEVRGNTVFSDAQIRQVTDRFVGKQATFEDLLAIRAAITDLYTENGYTTSGAFLPPQDLTSGTVIIQAVEGELERVDITGLRRLRQFYVRDRIGLAAGPPVNIQQLERALQLLQLDPLFESIQAELSPGTTPGRSILTLNLKEASPFNATLGVNNNNPSSTGALGGTVIASYTNPLGLGDRLSAGYEITEGVDTYNVAYSVPLNARDGSLSLSYENGGSEIVQDPFAELGINSDSKTFSIGFRQPLTRTPSNEFALGLALDLRRSQTYLFEDEPFSFSEGPENEESKVTVLRLRQDWLTRNSRRVLAARSQFSVGLDLFDATINDSGTDGQFFSWVGQFQWVQALTPNLIGLVRVGTQLTPDSLLSLEQFSIGGIDTVRGYPQDELVGDNGAAGSIELRWAIVQNPNGIGQIQLVPFVDVGTVWNTNQTNPSPNTIASTGLELRWQFRDWLEAQLGYGLQLVDVDGSGDSLQDSGVFFSLSISPF